MSASNNARDIAKDLRSRNLESYSWAQRVIDLDIHIPEQACSSQVWLTATRLSDKQDILVSASVGVNPYERFVRWIFGGSYEGTFPKDSLLRTTYPDLFVYHWSPFHSRGWKDRIVRQMLTYFEMLATEGGDAIYGHLTDKDGSVGDAFQRLRALWAEVALRYGARVTFKDGALVIGGVARAWVDNSRIHVRYDLNAITEVKPLRLRLIADLAEVSEPFNPASKVVR